VSVETKCVELLAGAVRPGPADEVVVLHAHQALIAEQVTQPREELDLGLALGLEPGVEVGEVVGGGGKHWSYDILNSYPNRNLTTKNSATTSEIQMHSGAKPDLRKEVQACKKPSNKACERAHFIIPNSRKCEERKENYHPGPDKRGTLVRCGWEVDHRAAGRAWL